MECATSEAEPSVMDEISDGIANIKCDGKIITSIAADTKSTYLCGIHEDETEVDKDQNNSNKSSSSRSRIPRPEVSISGFKQDCSSNAPKRTTSSGNKVKNVRNSTKKGKARRNSAEIKDKVPPKFGYPRSESAEGYSFTMKQCDNHSDGSWMPVKDNLWSYTYTDTDNCPLHGAPESSINTLVTASDPGPSTSLSNNISASRPVLVSGVLSEENSSGANAQSGQSAKNKKKKYNSYISLTEIQKGLKKGEVLEGVLRINQRNYEESYISSPQEDQTDIYIGGMRDRNRALHGDIIAYKLKSPEHWKINKEAIATYESQHGPLQFPNDQVKTSTILPEHNFCTNDFLKSPDHVSLSNHLLASSVNSKATSNHCTFANPEKPAQDSNLEWGNFNPGDPNISNLASSDFGSSWVQPGDIATQPHSVEILGLENLQDFERYKIGHCCGDESLLENGVKREPISPGNDCLKFDDWQNLDPNVSGSSCLGYSGLVVSPEEILMDNEGKFISTVVDNVPSNDEPDGLHPITVVAPDELSERESANSDDVRSVGSLNMLNTEDHEFFYAQLNALNNNQENQDILIDPIRVDNFVENTEEPEQKIVEFYDDVDGCADDHTVIKAKKKKSWRRSKKKASKTGDETVKIDQSDILDDSESASTGFVEPTSLKGSKIEDPNSSNVNYNTEKTEGKIDDLPKADFSRDSNEQTSGINRKKKKRNRRRRIKSTQPGDWKSTEKAATERKLLKEVSSHNKSIVDKNLIQQYSVKQLLQHHEANKFVKKTAEVVGIVAKKHPRIAIGHIKLQQNKDKNFALFSPIDSRVPRVMIPMAQCPQDFYTRAKDYEKSLIAVVITDWKEDSLFAHGDIVKFLGQNGEIEAETESILINNGFDYSEFPDYAISSISINLPWSIPKVEIAKRKDFRHECIFTIDPATARDLDDAVSCRYIGDGCYKISIHIADVSYFVPDGSIVDKIAKERATSVYLVQRVIPMLPRILSEELCSLNPAEDKLTFSVEWVITEKGEVLSEWFGRGMINSCAKLNYDHAQDIIEHVDTGTLTDLQIPKVSGNFSVKDIVESIKFLHMIAKNLRSKRFDSGALRIDQIKMNFNLDCETGLPFGCGTYEIKDSHRLIEEYMLLANMAVAHFIYNHYPDSAFLRCHPPPQKPLMEKTTEMCAALGICIDDESSKTLQVSLSLHNGEDLLSKARHAVLSNLYSKPMNCAKYFCSNSSEDKTHFYHYALNVPLYTHFTSPIRRYADIVVHRQLAAALNIGPKVKVPRKNLIVQAELCNEKKYNAKKASEMSAEVFLGLFVRDCGPMKEKAMVIGVMDRSFDVLLLSFGTTKRVYCNKLGIKSYSHSLTLGASELTLVWPSANTSDGNANCLDNNTQVITLFCPVDVSLVSAEEGGCMFSAILLRPGPIQK